MSAPEHPPAAHPAPSAPRVPAGLARAGSLAAVPTQVGTAHGAARGAATGRPCAACGTAPGGVAPRVHLGDVVVCDPDDVSALLAAEVLGGAGHRVAVRDLADVLTDPAGSPVLVLADPCRTGPAADAVAALRRSPGGRHVEVVVLTATRDPDKAAELLDAGADVVLNRPWGPTSLRANVAAHLRRHRATCAAPGGDDAC